MSAVSSPSAPSAASLAGTAGGTAPAAPSAPASPAPSSPEAHLAAEKAAFEELGGGPAGDQGMDVKYPWEEGAKGEKPAAKGDQNTPAKGASAKDAPEKKPAGEGAKRPAAKAKGEPAAPADPLASEDTRTKVILAKRALARDGMSNKAIDLLLKDDAAEFISMGEKASKRQDDIDRKLKGQDAPPSGAKQSTGGVNTGATGDHDPAGRSRDGADDAGAGSTTSTDPIDQMIEDGQITPEAATRVRELHRSADEKVQAATRLAAQTRFESARAQLAEQFPDLTSEEGEAKVLAKLKRFDPRAEVLHGTDPAEFTQLMRDACYAVWGEEIGQRTREDLLAGNAAARDGQPDTASPRSTDPSAITADEREKMIFRAAAESGGDQGEFDKVAGRLVPAR